MAEHSKQAMAAAKMVILESYRASSLKELYTIEDEKEQFKKRILKFATIIEEEYASKIAELRAEIDSLKAIILKANLAKEGRKE